MAAYAGDRSGKLWRFDLQSENTSSWKVGFNGSPLYVTEGGDNQSITGQPEYILHPQGGQLVIFGTGRLYEDADVADMSLQSLYGIWDTVKLTDESYASAAVRPGDSLHAQSFSGTINFGGTEYIQMADTGPLDWAAVRGWKLPLTLGDGSGQRSVYSPQLVRGYVLFNTVAPRASAGVGCSANESLAFNILINALSGAAPGKPALDTDGVIGIDGNDMITAGYQTTADGIDRVMLGTNGSVSFQRTFGQTTARINGRSLERSWRQLLNPPN